MQITLLSARGIHAREITGIEALKIRLPSEWYGFANLEMVQAPGRSRQIDVVLVIEDRILIVDLKDWRGRITSDGHSWYQDKQVMEASPVGKILDNARVLAGMLRDYLKGLATLQRNGDGRDQGRIGVPFVQGCVVLTNRCKIELAEDERRNVFFMDELCRALTSSNKWDRYDLLGEPPWVDRQNPLTGNESPWRHRLNAFFRAKDRFKPQEIIYADHRVCSEATFIHARGLYEEFDVEEISGARASGLLRRWDFAKALTRYASEEARAEVAGREQEVLGFLTARAPALESVLLRAKARDLGLGVRYWEIFERRRELKRLREFLRANEAQLTSADRENLIRVLLDHVATIHRLGAAHADLGPHSIWLERPTSVRLSHLLAAHFPEVRTLGQDRFAFLANDTVLPETILGEATMPFQKDVFLLGIAAHELAFGTPPGGNTEGDAPRWDPVIDVQDRFRRLHGWFDQALAITAEHRFTDAQAMLDAFNEATQAPPLSAAVLERLERFRRWPSINALLRAYPETVNLGEDSFRTMYRSDQSERSFLVKCWSPSHYGERQQEAARLLAFLDNAEDLARRALGGVCRPVEAGFAGDSLVLVQEFHAALSLAQELASRREDWRNGHATLRFLLVLCKAVEGLHAAGHAHGDVSPGNIMVLRNGDAAPSPVLVDVLDLARAGEGELRTPAYAPPFAADASARDRYGVLRIGEDLLQIGTLAEDELAVLRRALATCKDGPPRLATLAPLVEAIQAVLEPKPALPRLELSWTAPKTEPGDLLPDDGVFRVVPDTPPGARWTRLLVTGAGRELVVDLEPGGMIRAANIRPLPQSEAAWRDLKAIARFTGAVKWVNGPAREFAGLFPLLQLSEVLSWRSQKAPTDEPAAPLAPTTPADETGPATEFAPATRDPALLEEDLAAGVEGPPVAPVADVAALWRTLLEVEAEQVSRAVAEDDSEYAPRQRRHMVPYAMLAGTLDYDIDEPVQVEALARSGQWRRLGNLDVARSTDKYLALETASRAAHGTVLVNAGTELRFIGVRDADSRARRASATDIILERRSGILDLIDYFLPQGSGPDAAVALAPSGSTPLTAETARDRYGLNPSQAEALAHVWSIRPLGLLQGPPGTGKTTFIAALVHHALLAGGLRNVLLASQSHEAVNTVAEAILDLCRTLGGEPSLIRVGQEPQVSEALKPFHSARVEARYRDQFRARLKEKLRLVGRQIGVDDDFLDELFFLEATVAPILRRIADEVANKADETGEGSGPDRLGELRATALRLLAERGLPLLTEQELGEPDAIEQIVHRLDAVSRGISKDQVRRLLDLNELARDWLNSVNSRQRNFESFLVGTRQIVCGTCVGLGRAGLMPPPGSFDLVVIDEAARCTAGELAIPMQAGRWVVLVGDQAQLEPYHEPGVIEETARRLQLAPAAARQSDFERAFGSPFGRRAGRTLRTQYRMLPPIGQLVSACFYEGKLDHGRTTSGIPSSCLPPVLAAPVMWLDTSRMGEEAFQRAGGKERRSLRNEAEALAVVELLRRLDGHEPFRAWLGAQPAASPPIGIICMYAAQRDLLRERLAATPLSAQLRQGWRIGTVDSYQGKENRVVILSLVRNNDQGPWEAGVPTIKEGFMARANRINVAISRAMDQLVIVGSQHRWPEGGPMARVASCVRDLAEDGTAVILDHV